MTQSQTLFRGSPADGTGATASSRALEAASLLGVTSESRPGGRSDFSTEFVAAMRQIGEIPEQLGQAFSQSYQAFASQHPEMAEWTEATWETVKLDLFTGALGYATQSGREAAAKFNAAMLRTPYGKFALLISAIMAAVYTGQQIFEAKDAIHAFNEFFGQVAREIVNQGIYGGNPPSPPGLRLNYELLFGRA